MCKFGSVSKGSFLSYQQQVKPNCNPKVHIVDTAVPEPPCFSAPNIQQLYTSVFLLSQQNFLDGLKVSLAQSVMYESETRNQGSDSLRYELKAQRLTSSNFKDFCCRRKEFDSLAARLLRKTIQTAAMKHGLDNEEKAAQSFSENCNLNVYPCGIIINPSCPHLATSPDRRVYDSCEDDSWGLLEIKCPITDSITGLQYLKEVEGVLRLKTNHDYSYQVMGQMLISGAKWVEYYVCCKEDFHLERIRADPEFQNTMKDKLDSFYFEYLLPRLMAKSVVTLS